MSLQYIQLATAQSRLEQIISGSMPIERDAIDSLVGEITRLLSQIPDSDRDRRVIETAQELCGRARALAAVEEADDGGAAGGGGALFPQGRVSVVASAVLGRDRPLLAESNEGPQIAKPVSYFGNYVHGIVSRGETSKYPAAVKRNLLESRYDAKVLVRGDGDCLIRSTMVGLLLAGKLNVIEDFLIEYVQSGSFETLRGNGDLEGYQLEDEHIITLLEMIESIKSGELQLADIFYPESHFFDSSFCDIMRTAIAARIRDEGFCPEIDALKEGLIDEALTQKTYLGPYHERALAEVLGIRLATIRVNNGYRPYALEGIDQFYGVEVGVYGKDKEEEDVTLYFEGEDEGHYDVLVTNREGARLDVVRLTQLLDGLKAEVDRADLSVERIKPVLERGYALTPVTREVFSSGVLKHAVLRFRRVLDSLKARAETRLHRSIPLDGQKECFAQCTFHPDLPSYAPYMSAFVPLGKEADSEEALHRFLMSPSRATASEVLHHLNLYFSHDVRSEVFARYKGEDKAGLIRAMVDVLTSYDGEKKERANRLFGAVYTLLGSDDRGEGIGFGVNHLFESPYSFSRALCFEG